MSKTKAIVIKKTGLIKFDQAIAAIEKARTIDEVKDIRDKAEAARKYAAQAGISLHGQNMLAEIKLRAERKAGEILETMERQKRGGDRKSKSHSATLIPQLENMGISKTQASRWQQEADVPKKVFEEHVQKITTAAKELTSSGLLKLAKDLTRKKAQGDRAEKGSKLPGKAERYQLLHGDFTTIAVANNSLDWIITDPPYPKEFLPLYPKLAAFAEAKLKDGGSLLCMVGQSYLPQIYTTLGESLTYRWTLPYMTPGSACAIWQAQIGSHWKPVLWYSKGKPAKRLSLTDDVCTSIKSDKAHHDWGQSESGMQSLIGRFVSPGDKVCDPFMGAGTTGVIALRLDCYFLGIDVDDEAVSISKGRLHDEATI